MDYRSKAVREEPEMPDKRVTTTASGSTKTRSKSAIQKFFREFISEDIDDIGTYIRKEVLIPGIKKLVDDGVHGLLYHGERRSTGGPSRIQTFTPYNNPSAAKVTNHSGSVLNYEDVIFDNRGDAEAALSLLKELADYYGHARLKDLYEFAEKSCPYTYSDWGWTDLRTAAVVSVHDGYMVKLPRIISLK